MTLVVLKPKWPGVFKRSVRDEKGDVAQVLEFVDGDAIDLDDSQLAAVEKDIGVALFLAKVNSKPDYEATKAHVDLAKEAAELKAKKPKGKKQEG